jgi:lipoprotein-anchoring transpeptidase ErfK/SrfK
MCRRTAVSACAVAATVLATSAVVSTSARGQTAHSLYAGGTEVASPKRDALALRVRPGSNRVLAWSQAETEFGSTARFAVVGRERGWLEVISALLGNDVHGYVRRSEVRLARRPFVLEADLSRRQLVVWRWGQRVRRLPIAIGAGISPTPTGRFSVTDKLRDYAPSTYGCCILALSGHQTRLPPGWSGGDRLAIHEGDNLGQAVSAGCLRATRSDMRYLMRAIPLGTEIVIHP